MQEHQDHQVHLRFQPQDHHTFQLRHLHQLMELAGQVLKVQPAQQEPVVQLDQLVEVVVVVIVPGVQDFPFPLQTHQLLQVVVQAQAEELAAVVREHLHCRVQALHH